MNNQFSWERRGRGRGRCWGGSRGRGGGMGQGRRSDGEKLGPGPGDFCVCPKCGHREPHIAGQPCRDQTCPECGTKMIRE